jgi:hypothetical protein
MLAIVYSSNTAESVCLSVGTCTLDMKLEKAASALVTSELCNPQKRVDSKQRTIKAFICRNFYKVECTYHNANYVAKDDEPYRQQNFD